jgi:hypothetical protein
MQAVPVAAAEVGVPYMKRAQACLPANGTQKPLKDKRPATAMASASPKAIRSITEMLEILQSAAKRQKVMSQPQRTPPSQTNLPTPAAATAVPGTVLTSMADVAEAEEALTACLGQQHVPCTGTRSMEEILEAEEKLDELHDAALQVLILVRKQRKALHNDALAAAASTSTTLAAALPSQGTAKKKAATLAAAVAASVGRPANVSSQPPGASSHGSPSALAAARAGATQPSKQTSRWTVSQRLVNSLHNANRKQAAAAAVVPPYLYALPSRAHPQLHPRPSPCRDLPFLALASHQLPASSPSPLLSGQRPQLCPLNTLEEVTQYSMPSTTPDNRLPLEFHILSAADEAPPPATSAGPQPTSPNFSSIPPERVSSSAPLAAHASLLPVNTIHEAVAPGTRDPVAAQEVLANDNGALLPIAGPAAQAGQACGTFHSSDGGIGYHSVGKDPAVQNAPNG